jgi:hypothetical protein
MQTVLPTNREKNRKTGKKPENSDEPAVLQVGPVLL